MKLLPTRPLMTALLAGSFLASPAPAAEAKDIPATAAAAGSFETLVTALSESGLVPALKGKGPFTVFAPVDAAFAHLPEGTVNELLETRSRDRLRAILKFHVVPGRFTAADLAERASLTTLQGGTLPVARRDGRLSVKGALLLDTDIACTNGIIHVIDSVLVPPAPARRGAVRTLLELAIDRGVPLFNQGQVEACAAIYEIAAAGALAAGDDLTAAEQKALRDALTAARRVDDAREGAWILRRALDEALGSLDRPAPAARTAQPAPRRDAGAAYVREAALPQGFPAPGPVGEVVAKDYPRYRAARAAGGRFAFGMLFAHIKSNDIAMTAPVEMAMDESPSGAMDMRSMAFLYASPELGETGRDGRVEVVDLPPQRVLSYGMNGPVTSDKLAAARRSIEARLKIDGLKRDGGWRLMGYNSPMVPETKRFYEFQLPVAAPSDS